MSQDRHVTTRTGRASEGSDTDITREKKKKAKGSCLYHACESNPSSQDRHISSTLREEIDYKSHYFHEIRALREDRI